MGTKFRVGGREFELVGYGHEHIEAESASLLFENDKRYGNPRYPLAIFALDLKGGLTLYR